MKNKMKKWLLGLSCSLLVVNVGVLSSCDFNNDNSDPTDTPDLEREINPEITNKVVDVDQEIKISYTMAGFGDDWIKVAVNQFNRVYEGHGYKAVLGRDDANFQTDEVLSEIKHPEDNDYDLYFEISENAVTQLIDGSYSILKSKDKTLLADLTSLLDEKPIDLAGYEEKETIRETINEATIMYDKYTSNPSSKWNDKVFAMQWTRSVSGMVINMDVLHQAGYEEIPYTTNEYFAMINSIASRNDLYSPSSGQKIYPVTWPGANAAGYFSYSFLTWLAQWKGYQGYNDFYALNPATGNTIDNGYDVYNDIGIQYCLEALRKTVDQDMAMNGTVTTVDHLQSEMALAEGEALIAATGDWCYNELIGCAYTDEELANIEVLPVPVLSEIAGLINLGGKDAAEKDKVLARVIKGLDNDEGDAAIKSAIQSTYGVELTDAQLERIKEARGVYFDMGTTHHCIIPSYSDAIDGARLFIKFIYSKEFADTTYGKYAHAVTANQLARPEQSNYLKSLAKIANKPYSQAVGYADKLSMIRMNGGIGFALEPYPHWVDIVKGMALKQNGFESETVYNRVKNAMTDNWETIIESSGVLD